MSASSVLSPEAAESARERLAHRGRAIRGYFAPWQRRALVLVALVAAFCDFFQLQANGYGNLYYAAAIRSMLESWHNFFFVSFDPGGFVTVDKPPLGFWIQAASAKIFGFSGFSILLPEALAGIGSVLVLYALVRRVFGPGAGLLAALFLAITPVSVVTNRNNTIDSLLVLAVLLGAYAVSRAAERGSLRWLLLCAVLVGLGFNIKMLEAYLVAPAFAAVYLLRAPRRWRTRLWHLALAGGVMVVISLAWVVAVDLTPASARPYVGSSGSNSELALALGYNGIERLLGMLFNVPSSGTGGGTTAVVLGAGGGGGVGGASENGAQGIFRLLDAELGGQASWLLALGIAGILASGWGVRLSGGARALRGRISMWRASGEARAAAHLTPQQTALVLWGLWTLTQVVFFSVAGFFHRYYLSMLAPGIAALAGIGLALLWRDYQRRTDSVDWRGWLLPAALLLTAITQGVILADYSGWNAWMTPLIVGGSLLAAGALVWLRIVRIRDARGMAQFEGYGGVWQPARLGLPARLARWRHAPTLAVAFGVALLLAGPVTWTGVSLLSGASAALPAAGPSA
ncbi:MAG: glycosyltransferase family 39 protein, partial [Ktedonobacterales bacterium]